jgi:hypothetical protein
MLSLSALAESKLFLFPLTTINRQGFDPRRRSTVHFRILLPPWRSWSARMACACVEVEKKASLLAQSHPASLLSFNYLPDMRDTASLPHSYVRIATIYSELSSYDSPCNTASSSARFLDFSYPPSSSSFFSFTRPSNQPSLSRESSSTSYGSPSINSDSPHYGRSSLFDPFAAPPERVRQLAPTEPRRRASMSDLRPIAITTASPALSSFPSTPMFLPPFLGPKYPTDLSPHYSDISTRAPRITTVSQYPLFPLPSHTFPPNHPSPPDFPSYQAALPAHTVVSTIVHRRQLSDATVSTLELGGSARMASFFSRGRSGGVWKKRTLAVSSWSGVASEEIGQTVTTGYIHLLKGKGLGAVEVCLLLTRLHCGVLRPFERAGELS